MSTGVARLAVGVLLVATMTFVPSGHGVAEATHWPNWCGVSGTVLAGETIGCRFSCTTTNSFRVAAEISPDGAMHATAACGGTATSCQTRVPETACSGVSPTWALYPDAPLDGDLGRDNCTAQNVGVAARAISLVCHPSEPWETATLTATGTMTLTPAIGYPVVTAPMTGNAVFQSTTCGGTWATNNPTNPFDSAGAGSCTLALQGTFGPRLGGPGGGGWCGWLGGVLQGDATIAGFGTGGEHFYALTDVAYDWGPPIGGGVMTGWASQGFMSGTTVGLIHFIPPTTAATPNESCVNGTARDIIATISLTILLSE